MKRKPRPFDSVEGTRATTNARLFLRNLLRRAERASNDEDKETRVAAQWCSGCWYVLRGGMAGAAVTVQPCACCLIDQHYGSTNTDALCKPCAKAHSLCKHCGGDFEMRNNRRKWPSRGTS